MQYLVETERDLRVADRFRAHRTPRRLRVVACWSLALLALIGWVHLITDGLPDRTQAKWVTLGHEGPGPRTGAIAAAMNASEVLIIGGHAATKCDAGTPCAVDDSPSTFGMLFDVPIGRWFPMADAPVGLDNRDASAVLGLDLYVLTRPTSPTSARLFLRFDRQANNWESLPIPDIPSDVPYRLVSDGVGLIAYASTSGDDTVVDVRYYPDTGWSPLPTAPARASAERAYYHVGDDPVVFTRDEPSAGGALHVDRLHALTWQPVPAPEGGGQLPLQVGPSVVFIPDAVERRQVRAQMLWTDWVWRPVGPRLTAATGSLAVNVLGADRYPSLDGPTVDLSTSKVLKQPKIPSELRPLRDPAMVVVGSDLFVFGGTIDRPAGSLPTDSAFLFHPSVSISYDD